MLKKYFNLTTLTIATALVLSTIAAWFAIVGLVNIFPAQAQAIFVMGAAIEFGKVVATIWLRKYWTRCGVGYKVLLVPMVVILMTLTSMGTFGFLSAAHSEQSALSGDVVAQVAIIDEKIKTQRENIDLARKALTQLDAQVDARLSRGDSEAGAERAVQIRRAQSTERAKLQAEIAAGQAEIAKLNELRAPQAAQLRKVEAEVGPIKYIAALLYGDNPDATVLERAVRWVIILLVIVFDPLAIALMLAGNSSRRWDQQDWDQEEQELKEHDRVVAQPLEEVVEPSAVVEEIAPIQVAEDAVPQSPPVVEETVVAPPVKEPLPFYLTKPWVNFKSGPPMVAKVDPISETPTEVETPVAAPLTALADQPIDTLDLSVDSTVPIVTNGVTTEVIDQPQYVESVPGYVVYEGKQMSLEALRGLRPELFTAQPATLTGWGDKFPQTASRGEFFIRTDVLPPRLYKFQGEEWMEINREGTSAYLDNADYIRYLISKIDSGEYDVEWLTEQENQAIGEYLLAQKT